MHPNPGWWSTLKKPRPSGLRCSRQFPCASASAQSMTVCPLPPKSWSCFRVPARVKVCRCYQRLALQATALDLRTAFINQPVEVAALRPEFARAIGIGGRRPDLIVRIGHGPLMPRSLRRPIEEVTSE